MKEDLQQKSIDLLKWLEQTIKTTTDFGAEQIPLLIQELLTYNYYRSLIFFILSCIALIVSLYVTYKFIKKVIEKRNNPNLFIFFPFLIITIIGACAGIFNNFDWLMIQLAPRVYLLEYVKEMIEQ